MLTVTDAYKEAQTRRFIGKLLATILTMVIVMVKGMLTMVRPRFLLSSKMGWKISPQMEKGLMSLMTRLYQRFGLWTIKDVFPWTYFDKKKRRNRNIQAKNFPSLWTCVILLIYYSFKTTAKTNSQIPSVSDFMGHRHARNCALLYR